MTHQFHHPTFAVTVDMALVGFQHDTVAILLIQRKYPPFAGHWALPGGFVDPNEDLLPAALRELHEESGLAPAWATQLQTYGTPGRDPRRHTMSVAHLGICVGTPAVTCSDETPVVAWHPLHALPALAFDHDQMVVAAQQLLVRGCHDLSLLSRFFAGTFRCDELHRLVCAITQTEVAFDAFTAAVRAHPTLRACGQARYQYVAGPYVPFVWSAS